MSKPKLSDFNLNTEEIRRYEIEMNGMRIKSDNADDHSRALQTIQALQKFTNHPSSPPSVAVEAGAHSLPSGLTLMEFLDKFLLVKKPKPATVTALTNTAKEFSSFVKNKCYLSAILVSDITRYQEYLAKKGNVPRTIDGKVGYIKTLLNFAIEQGYLIGKNPAMKKNLLTKKQKLNGGYATFELPEVVKIFSSSHYKTQKNDDPDYYFVLLIGLVTGCRISEITSLTVDQIQKSEAGTNYIVIRDAKTMAGKREVPIPNFVLNSGFQKFLEDKTGSVFKYDSRLGKGSGNAVGKKFKRHLELLKLDREKLVFHSIRKFVNDFYLKNGVEYEPRCQVIGHEIESVNVATYSKKFSIDELGKMISPVQSKILSAVGLLKL